MAKPKLNIEQQRSTCIGNALKWWVCLGTITGTLIVLSGCQSTGPKSAVDANIAAVSTAGLRLGMTPAEVIDVSARRLYKEDQRNDIRLSELKEKERATIRLERIRSISTVSTRDTYAFYSNAVTLTLQFARNRLVELEERHTGLGEEDLRAEMKEISTQFKFVANRIDTGSAAQWTYHGKNPSTHVRIDFRFVTATRARPTPMSSYTIVLADPSWATAPLYASDQSSVKQ
jgi:hypothetical protein